MPESIEIAKQWLAKARNDLLNVDNNLHAEVVPYDTVCFHSQQAAEKLLKAFLVGKNQILPITHDLFLLLEKVMLFNPEAEKLRGPLAILMPYAVEIRYPDNWFMPSEQDGKEAREAAEKVLVWLEYTLPEILQDEIN
jgi:HEPN domain-containing protein